MAGKKGENTKKVAGNAKVRTDHYACPSPAYLRFQRLLYRAVDVHFLDDVG